MATGDGAGIRVNKPDPTRDDEARQQSAYYQVLIVGAGISGIGIGISLRKHGIKDFALLEAASDLGGTWRDNTYPGVAVDIPSTSYCFSYETGFAWSRTYAPGREVQNYIHHCANKYDIGRHILYGSRVRRAQFDPARNHWEVQLVNGEKLLARFLVAATGLFSSPMSPDILGLDEFKGTVMHSALWKHDHDLAGHRVGVIGTGASAVQIVPEVAAQASALTVFQRTPIYVAPRFDFAHRPIEARFPKVVGRLRRLVSEFGIEALTSVAVNYARFPSITRVIQSLIQRWMRRQVNDEITAKNLIPTYDLGCKRPATSSRYLSSFNKENVKLEVNSIARITQTGAVCSDGTLHDLDTIILATGFQTTKKGNVPTFDVVGPDGQELSALWDDNRLGSYAGIAVSGFPNFFLTAGPYSGGFNWFTMLETHTKQIRACILEAQAQGAKRIDVDPKYYDNYVHLMWKLSEGTVFKSGNCQAAHSYYIDQHGDASLPAPRTPNWRARYAKLKGASEFRFSATSDRDDWSGS